MHLVNITGNITIFADSAADKRDTIRAALRAGKCLRGANLSGADLRGIRFRRCDLERANLDGVTMNWNDRCQIAERLRQAAGDDLGRRKFAGLIAISYDWCWPEFIRVAKDDPDWHWALSVFRGWVKPDDNAPEILTV